MTVGPATRAYHTIRSLEDQIMDGTDDTPTPEGVATLHRIENHIIRTRAAAYTVSRLVEEAFDSPHPSEAARRCPGIALLVDAITFNGLTSATSDLLRQVRETHDAIRAAGCAA